MQTASLMLCSAIVLLTGMGGQLLVPACARHLPRQHGRGAWATPFHLNRLRIICQTLCLPRSEFVSLCTSRS